MFNLMLIWMNWSPGILKLIIYIFEPLLENLLKKLKMLNVKPEVYILNVIINTIIYSTVLSAIIFAVYYMIGVDFEPSFVLITFLAFLSFFFIYPQVMITQMREKIDKELFYALRDLTVQVSAGIPLYSAIKNISKNDYGIVSEEFRKVVADIESGVSLDDALKKMMNRTYSEHLRRVLWQVIVVIRSGSSVVNVLEDILRSLKDSQHRRLSEYLYEMNMWIVIFLIASITLPALVFALSSVFTTFVGINPFSLILFMIIISSVFQVIMIWYVKVRRPNIIE